MSTQVQLSTVATSETVDLYTDGESYTLDCRELAITLHDLDKSDLRDLLEVLRTASLEGHLDEPDVLGYRDLLTP